MKADRSLGWILGVAGGLRFLWGLLVPMQPVSDGVAYWTFAQNLAAGGAFGWDPAVPDAFWPPGAPFYYALFIRAFGDSFIPIVIGNWVLSMLVVILTMRLVAVWEGPPAARVAGWLLALWPLQIQLVTILASELPFTVAMLVALWIASPVHAESGSVPTLRLPGWTRVVAVGVFIAAAAYLRTTALLLPGGLALIALWRGARWGPVLARTALMVVVVAALIAPWTMRNYRVFGQWVPVAANSGANLWMGNNPDSVGEYMPVPRELKSLDRATQDAILRARALEWIGSEPGTALALVVRKLGISHGRETIGVVWNAKGLAERGLGDLGLLGLRGISTLYWFGVLGLGLAGLGLALRREGLGSLPAVFWIYFAAVHALTVAMDRYHLPSVPFIAWLAASAWLPLRAHLQARLAKGWPWETPGAATRSG